MSESLKDKYPTLRPHQATLVEQILNVSPPKRIYLTAAVGTGSTIAICNAIAAGMESRRFNRVLFLGRKAILEHTRSTIDNLSREIDCVLLDGRRLKHMAARFADDSSMWLDRSVYLTTLPFAARTGTDHRIQEASWDLIIFDEELGSHIPSDLRLFVQNLTELQSAIAIFVSRFDASVQRSLFKNDSENAIEVSWRPGDLQNWSGAKLTRPSVQWNVVEYEMSKSEARLIEQLYSCRKAIDELAGNSAAKVRVTNFENLVHRAMSSVYSLERALMDVRSYIRKICNSKAHGLGSAAIQQSLFEDEDPDLVATQMDLFSESIYAAEIENLESAITAIDLMLQDIERIETDEKLAVLLKLLASIESPHVIVVTRYSATLEFLETAFEQENLRLFTISGRSTEQEAQSSLNAFQESGGVLLVTDAGMKGMELSPMTVIHYDIPVSQQMMAFRTARFRRYGEAGTLQMYVIVERNSPLSELWRRKLLAAMSDNTPAESSVPDGQ